MLLTVIRWWLIAFYVEYLSILLFAQLLHAASYGLFHASAIHLIDGYFSGKIQGRGQALFASISFGLGGSLGSLVSGYTWKLNRAFLCVFIGDVYSLDRLNSVLVDC